MSLGCRAVKFRIIFSIRMFITELCVGSKHAHVVLIIQDPLLDLFVRLFILIFGVLAEIEDSFYVMLVLLGFRQRRS
jgi:hypothetical protein